MFCAINLKVLLKATSANCFVVLTHPSFWSCSVDSFFPRFWFLILLGVKYGFSGLNLLVTWLQQSSQLLCLTSSSFRLDHSLCVLGAPRVSSKRLSSGFTLSGDNSCVCLVPLGYCFAWVIAGTHKWDLNNPCRDQCEELYVKLNATSKGIMISLSTCQNSEALLNSYVLLLLHVNLTIQLADTTNILSAFKQQWLSNTQLLHFK